METSVLPSVATRAQLFLVIASRDWQSTRPIFLSYVTHASLARLGVILERGGFPAWAVRVVRPPRCGNR
jgi:hypothetical protein